MPRTYFRLNELGEPIEHSEDNDETLDATRVRWSRWMASNQAVRRTLDTRFRGGFWEEGGFTVSTDFQGFSDLRRTDPAFPQGIWRTKIFGPIPAGHPLHAWKMYHGGRMGALAGNAAAVQLLVDAGFLGERERPD